MKHLFLAIIATGLIFATSCKKKEAPMQATNSSWKTSDWVLIKTGVNIEGTTCDLYRNTKTGQEVCEAVEKSRAITYDYDYWVDSFGVSHCKFSGNECWTGTIDGEKVIILPKK